MSEASVLLARAIALGKFGDDQSRRVRVAANNYRRRRARDAVSQVEIATLPGDAGEAKQLRKRGILTAGQWLTSQRAANQATEFPSVASQVEALVQQQLVQQQPTPSGTDDRRLNLQLLKELQALLRWQSAMATLAGDKPVRFYVDRMVADDHLPRLLTVADEAGMDSPLRVYFASEEVRERGLKALQVLLRIVQSGDAQLIDSAWSDVNEAIPMNVSLLADYRQRASEYTSTLAAVLPSEEEDRARHGELEERLVERIEKQPITAAAIKVPLRGYQVFGAQFALTQKRALLGDEMGLGKTLQALTASAHLLGSSRGRHLVVCPASLLLNWQHEIQAKTSLQSLLLHGPAHKREAATLQWLKGGQIGLTSYETLAVLPIPEDTDLDLLVVDEAHYVKNPSARRTKSVRSRIGTANHVLLMTGTPLENKLGEFVSLVGMLQPIVARQLTAAGAMRSQDFKRAAGPVYLRRNQGQVLRDLPELIEIEELLSFSAEDMVAYRDAVSGGNYQLMRRAAFLSRRSAKLDRLKDICESAVEEGNKILIFTQFLDVLDAVRSRIGALCVGTIQGSVSFKERDALVRSFAAAPKPCALLSQINAGGVGLNIQAASTVVLCEPQYKPSTEVQAVARARRMGQIKPVSVHRLMVEDSVDRLIRDRAEEKQRVFDQFVRDAHAARVPQATDMSEVDFQKWAVEFERSRLGVSA
jgi:superfamily II DNA or RNA helicase